MTPERQQLIDHLYYVALRQDWNNRAAVVASACGKDEDYAARSNKSTSAVSPYKPVSLVDHENFDVKVSLNIDCKSIRNFTPHFTDELVDSTLTVYGRFTTLGFSSNTLKPA